MHTGPRHAFSALFGVSPGQRTPPGRKKRIQIDLQHPAFRSLRRGVPVQGEEPIHRQVGGIADLAIELLVVGPDLPDLAGIDEARQDERAGGARYRS